MAMLSNRVPLRGSIGSVGNPSRRTRCWLHKKRYLGEPATGTAGWWRFPYHLFNRNVEHTTYKFTRKIHNYIRTYKQKPCMTSILILYTRIGSMIDHSSVSVNIAVSCLACTTTQQKLGPLPAPKTSGFCWKPRVLARTRQLRWGSILNQRWKQHLCTKLW